MELYALIGKVFLINFDHHFGTQAESIRKNFCHFHGNNVKLSVNDARKSFVQRWVQFFQALDQIVVLSIVFFV